MNGIEEKIKGRILQKSRGTHEVKGVGDVTFSVTIHACACENDDGMVTIITSDDKEGIRKDVIVSCPNCKEQYLSLLGECPIPVTLLLDEFVNLGEMPSISEADLR